MTLHSFCVHLYTQSRHQYHIVRMIIRQIPHLTLLQAIYIATQTFVTSVKV